MISVPNHQTREFRRADTDPVVDLSLRAWEPVFASFVKVWGEALFTRFYPDWRSHQAEAVRDALDKNETWVTIDGSTVTGFVNVIFTSDDAAAEIYMIAVDPEYQRQGLAKELIELALAEMRTRGITLATVGTGGDPGHEPARLTYEQLGFTPFPQVFYSKLLEPDE